jgi:hypothetical protein
VAGAVKTLWLLRKLPASNLTTFLVLLINRLFSDLWKPINVTFTLIMPCSDVFFRATMGKRSRLDLLQFIFFSITSRKGNYVFSWFAIYIFLGRKSVNSSKNFWLTDLNITSNRTPSPWRSSYFNTKCEPSSTNSASWHQGIRGRLQQSIC